MEVTINDNHLKLIIGDITKQSTDTIVNAANGSLMGGGGVDGAIHQAAGKELIQECKKIREVKLGGKYLATGETVITKGYQLPAKYVIHTVGPVWNEQAHGQEKLLKNCYHHALMQAHHYELSSISFPSISTGVYHFPIEKAASIALQTIIDFLQDYTFGEVVMVLFSDNDLQVYEQALTEAKY